VIEPAIGGLGLLAGAVLAVSSTSPLVVSIPDLFKWAGLMLMIQGFIRDLVLLSQGCGCARGDGTRKALALCMESTIGMALILTYALLLFLGARGEVRLSAAAAVLLGSAWWIFGYLTRDLVLELKSEKDHLNLLVGLPGRKES